MGDNLLKFLELFGLEVDDVVGEGGILKGPKVYPQVVRRNEIGLIRGEAH